MKIGISIKIKATLLLTILSGIAYANPPRGDGQLSLYYAARNESLSVTFRDNMGKLIPSATKQISHFLRSPDNDAHPINAQLIDLLDAIQDQFREPVIEIISGYRSPSYNRSLRETGHAVGSESLHMSGEAIDIHLDNTTEEDVRDFAISLQQGGVGWYPQNDFVHIDLGPVRTWGHAETKRKFVGLTNNKGPLEIRSNSNRYFSGEDVFFTATQPQTRINWTLERFDRGSWILVNSGNSSLTKNRFIIADSIFSSLPFGRYRLKIEDSLSNEFYRKEKKLK